jgi:hypothetical protein
MPWVSSSEVVGERTPQVRSGLGFARQRAGDTVGVVQPPVAVAAPALAARLAGRGCQIVRNVGTIAIRIENSYRYRSTSSTLRPKGSTRVARRQPRSMVSWRPSQDEARAGVVIAFTLRSALDETFGTA